MRLIRRIGNHENRKYKLRTIDLELSSILSNPVRQCVILNVKFMKSFYIIMDLCDSETHITVE